MRRAAEKGAALVEFAMVLTPLILLLFGVIEFGFFIFNKAVITNASREGARAGVIYSFADDPADPDNPFLRISAADITTVVNNYAAAHLVSFCDEDQPVSVTFNPNPFDRKLPAGQNLTVTVSHPYCFMTIPSFAAVGEDINITGITVMRTE